MMDGEEMEDAPMRQENKVRVDFTQGKLEGLEKCSGGGASIWLGLNPKNL